MNKIKNKLALIGATIMSAPILLAQSASSNPFDFSDAETQADNMGTAIKDLLTGKIMNNVLTVIGAALSIWGLFLLVKWIRRGAK